MTIAAKPPEKPTIAVPEKSAAEKFDRFHPEMPRIPGVGNMAKPSRSADNRRLGQIGAVMAVVLVIGVATLWWVKRTPQTANDLPAQDPAVTVSSTPVPAIPPPVHQGPTVAATVEELSKPWAAKKFVFVNPLTNESVDAMVLRLPGGGLWGFSLQEPYGRCTLEFVTDLNQLATQYRYRASHPMVVNPCSNSLYDPLKVGPLGGDVWVRGEVVQGGGLRPPLAINIRVSGHSIIADRIE